MVEPVSDDEEWTDDRPFDERDIQKLAEELIRLKNSLIPEAKAKLAQLEERERNVKEVLLPDAMRRGGTLSRTLLDGTVIDVQERLLSCRIPEDKVAEAHAFVRRTGHDSIIKHVIALTLDRGDDELARRIVQGIRSGPGANRVGIEDKATIHPQTLGKYLRDRYAEGTAVPEELFGAYRRDVAKVTLPHGREDPF